MIGLFSLPRQGDQVFPPVRHRAGQERELRVFCCSRSSLFNDRARVLDFMQDACNMRQVFFFFFFFFFLPLSLFASPRKPRYIAFNIRSCFPVSLFDRGGREEKETLLLRNLSSTTPYILISLRLRDDNRNKNSPFLCRRFSSLFFLQSFVSSSPPNEVRFEVEGNSSWTDDISTRIFSNRSQFSETRLYSEGRKDGL